MTYGRLNVFQRIHKIGAAAATQRTTCATKIINRFFSFESIFSSNPKLRLSLLLQKTISQDFHSFLTVIVFLQLIARETVLRGVIDGQRAN